METQSNFEDFSNTPSKNTKIVIKNDRSHYTLFIVLILALVALLFLSFLVSASNFHLSEQSRPQLTGNNVSIAVLLSIATVLSIVVAVLSKSFKFSFLIAIYTLCLILILKLRYKSVHTFTTVLSQTTSVYIQEDYDKLSLTKKLEASKNGTDLLSPYPFDHLRTENGVTNKENVLVGYQERIGSENTFDISVSYQKIEAALQCLRYCKLGDNVNKKYTMQVDSLELRKHYYELLEVTAPYRPKHRSKSSIYKEYTGPRLEDHFIHNLIGEDFDTFSPIVPLFVHWTEVRYNRIKGGYTAMCNILLNHLRKDVIYLAVTTDWTSHAQEILKRYNIIFASSKGDKAAHIILPHLFYYNAPGYDVNGSPVFNNISYSTNKQDFAYDLSEYDLNKIYSVDAMSSRERASNRIKNLTAWRFRNYETYEAMPVLKIDAQEMIQYKAFMQSQKSNISNTAYEDAEVIFPDYHRISFVGSMSTHKGRLLMHTLLEANYKNDYFWGYFPVEQKCYDFSVKDNVSYCWRVFMLSSPFSLCPVGTAPVSYRLYESLQMGLIPIYVHDKNGAYIPFRGTKADINNIGYVTRFEDVEDTVKKILNLTEEDIKHKLKKVASVRNSHFTPSGVVSQLRSWLKFPHLAEKSDIRCCSNPEISKSGLR